MKKRLFITVSIFIVMMFIVLFATSVIIAHNQSRNSAEVYLKNVSSVVCAYHDGTNGETVVNDLNTHYPELRISIITIEGVVVYDSDADALDNHIDRPEIQNPGTIYYRKSATLDRRLMYLAVVDDGYYVRIAQPVKTIYMFVSKFVLFGGLTSLVILALTIILMWYVINWSFKPLKNQLDKLGTFVSKTVDEHDDLETLSLQIENINDLIDQTISELTAEKNRINLILNNLDSGIIVINLKKQVQFINDRALKILTWSRSQVIGKAIEFLIRDNQAIEKLDKLIADDVPFSQHIKLNNRTYFLKAFAILKEQYHITEDNVLISLVDVEEEMRLAKTKRDFFANASHELKSPLTTIIAYQQMLEQGILKSKTEITEAHTKTVAEAKRMQAIINNMLDLAELEASEVTEAAELNLKPVIEEVIEAMEAQFTQKGIKVATKLSDALVKIEKSEAETLLTNLLENACRYNKPHGSITVTLTERQLIVSDTGIGIPKEDIPRIFERFYRTDALPRHVVGSSGLGLAIVKHICLLRGFKIDVTSKVDHESTFTITF